MPNPFDDIQEHEWKPSQKTKAFTSPFDDIQDNEWQTPQPVRKGNTFSLGATVRGLGRQADSFVNTVQSVMPDSRNFFDANRRQVAERMQSQPDFDIFRQLGSDPGDYELAKRGATMIGAARMADQAINFLPGLYDMAANTPVDKRFRSNLARDLFYSSPEMGRLAEKFPGTFEAQQGTAATVLPLPGRVGELLGPGSKINASLGARLADATLTQGAIGASAALNDKLQRGQAPQAGDLFAGFAGGAALGGAFHGAGEALDAGGQAVGRAFGRWQDKARAGRIAQAAELTKANPEAAQNVLATIERQIAGGQIDASDPEIAAVINALRGSAQNIPQSETRLEGGITMSQLGEQLGALPAPDVKLSPFQMALAKVKNASEADLDAAIAEASKAIPRGAPKDYRKQLKAQLNEAYKENLVRRGIEPEQIGARPSEPEQVPPAGQGSVFDDIQPEEWQAKPVNYTPKRRLTASEEMELKQKELQLFPMHDAGWLKENRGRGNGFSLRLSHKEMPDAELDQFIAFTEGTTKMRSNSVAERRRASAELKAALDEKMRREYRRAQNLPEDWAGGVEDMRWHSEEKLADIASGPDEDPRTQEAAYELMRRAKEPAVEAPVVQQGEARKMLQRDESGRRVVGRMQANDGRDISEIEPALQGQVAEHFNTVARAKELEQQLEWLNEDVYKLLGGSGAEQVRYGKTYYKPTKIEKVLNGIGEALKNKVVDALASGTKPDVKYNLRTIAENPEDWVSRINPVQDAEVLDGIIAAHKEELKALDETLKSQRQNLKGKFEGSISAQIDYNGQKVRISVKDVNNQTQRELSEQAKGVVKKWESRLKEIEKYTKERKFVPTPGRKAPGLDARTAQALMTTGGASILSSTQGAFAADGQQNESDRKVNALLRATGWFLLAGGTLPLAKKLFKDKYGKVAMFFEDTLGHAQRLDDLLGAKGKDGLFWTINEHNAAAAQASWGVRFESQNQKAEALELLSSGKLAPTAALDPNLAKGTVFEQLSQEQKTAVIAYWASKKTLGKKITAYQKRLEAKLKDPNLSPAEAIALEKQYKDSLAVIHNLGVNFNSSKPRATIVESALNAGAGNIMDAFFLWNPQHHALNLLDSVIMGMFGFGTRRMFKAQIDMLSDKELRAAMADSNLFGSFRAERADLAGKAGNSPILPIEDLGSDTFNSNRVALMAWSEYFDLHKDALQKQGLANYKDFTKALLNKKLDADLSMDAFVHMMERSSRFLGVDPLRANKNMIASSDKLSWLVSFANQPVRVTRMIHHYANKGDTAALGRFVLITLALGGAAALPKEVRFALELLDPEAADVMEASMNSVSVPGLAANNIPGAAPFIPSLSEKIEYSGINPLAFGAVGLSSQIIGQAATSAIKATQNAGEGKTEQAQKEAYKAAKSSLQLGASRVPVLGLPVGESIRAGEDIAEAISGRMTYHAFNDFGKRVASRELDLDKIPGGRAMPLVDHIAPGIPAVIYQSKKKLLSDDRFKSRKQQPLIFEDLNVGPVRLPMSWQDPVQQMSKTK